MTRLRARITRDPGLALVVLGMLAAVVLYAPTLGTGIVNYDDPWLYRDNFVLQSLSWDSIVAVFTDTDPESPLRHVLAPEYLPIRDLSVMLDFAIWGDSYGGFHLTNLLLYLAAIALLFRMLTAFGFDRVIVGLAVFLWAIHPIHAESVAWLSERKGLLGIVFGATAGLAYARYRVADQRRGMVAWLALAAIATVCAVWSKAPAAFTIAAVAGLELIAPTRRASWKRVLAGLGTLGVFGVLAFLPVVSMAVRAAVVGKSIIPGDSTAEIVTGVHGFYVKLAVMAMPNALGYPISSLGASALELVLGGLGFVAIVAAFVPKLRAPPELKAAALLWTFTWLPISHLVLPLHMIGVADRYALVLVLGFTLALAVGIRRLPRVRMQVAVVSVIALAAMIRSLDARATWSSDLFLWERAVASNPNDSKAWSAYALELEAVGLDNEAAQAVDVGLAYGTSGRLLLRRAMLQLKHGEVDEAFATMGQAAEEGEPRAMGNYAQLLLERGRKDEALEWGRKAARYGPMLAQARRSHGMAALATAHPAEALESFSLTLALEPSALNRYNLALALLALGRASEAVPLLEQCVLDPRVGALAHEQLAALRRSRSVR
jgi:hypothetical protein